MDPKGKGMVVNDKEKESLFNEPRDDKPTDSGSSHKKRDGKKKRRIKKIIYYDSDASSSSPRDDDDEDSSKKKPVNQNYSFDYSRNPFNSNAHLLSIPLGKLWGTDIPWVHWKDKRPHGRPKGPINRKVIPSWAWGGMTSEADRHKAGSVQAQTTQQRRASNHNRDPTFPRWSPVQRNQARMSRQNYRKIDSIGSLFLRCALLSYLHVLPHSRIYKA
jgi:hypothetical protein